MASALAEGANIEKIGRLSRRTSGSVEIQPAAGGARQRAAQAGAARGGDAPASTSSLQRESLYRRSKRLVVMDMDSTLIRIEVIDELARAAGVGDQVSRITERAMQGEMDYDESLRQRVALLDGLDVAGAGPHRRRAAAHRGRRDADPRAQAPRLPHRGHQRRLLARRRGAQAPPGHRLRLLEQPRGRGRQAHRARRRADRQRPAQGRAAGDHRPGRGRAARPGDRRRRRRQRRADAGARRPGHRLPRQAPSCASRPTPASRPPAWTRSSTCWASVRRSCRR